jgi:hypothetical protein
MSQDVLFVRNSSTFVSSFHRAMSSWHKLQWAPRDFDALDVVGVVELWTRSKICDSWTDDLLQNILAPLFNPSSAVSRFQMAIPALTLRAVVRQFASTGFSCFWSQLSRLWPDYGISVETNCFRGLHLVNIVDDVSYDKLLEILVPSTLVEVRVLEWGIGKEICDLWTDDWFLQKLLLSV